MKKLKEFVMREIGGESILVPVRETTLEFNGVITLSDTAVFIWKHLEEAEDEEALVQMILREYRIDAETARTDLHELITQMKDANMI